MKIAITDNGSGIAHKLAKALDAKVSGRFIHIPESKGGGYLTGFSWGSELRMMIRNYHLNEEIIVKRTNELADGQQDVIFLLSGVFPSVAQPDRHLLPEQASLLICPHAVSTLMNMPSNTLFASVTIAVSKLYLQQLFGSLNHPVVISVLEAKDNFVLESAVSLPIISTAGDMLQPLVPEGLESLYYRLKCEELLCHIFALLIQREALPLSSLHTADIKALYAVKQHLQQHLSEPPHIAALARQAGMSEPKLRKLFRQTFGKGVFEYYQSARMQQAAQLLRGKRLTVSETGYALGFTNLSHFTRVFEKYMGMKPKKYAAG